MGGQGAVVFGRLAYNSQVELAVKCAAPFCYFVL
jgi:hypothetical protein